MLQVPTALKPATLLPDSDLEALLQTAPESRPRHTALNLKDTRLPDAEETWFKDKSSFLQNKLRHERAAATTTDKVVWAEPLPAGTSAQRAELIALTKLLKLGHENKINNYTGGRYAFATAHIHEAIYKERASRLQKGRLLKIRLRSWTF